jgi:hypothetical protein
MRLMNKSINQSKPHRHHDHRIPLIDDKIPPFEPLRAIDEGRLKALKEYIDTSLERGWIRSSTLPAGAPIHFDAAIHECESIRQVPA